MANIVKYKKLGNTNLQGSILADPINPVNVPTPSSGKFVIFNDSTDNSLSIKNSSGVITKLTTLHDNLAGLLGGDAGGRYHMTEAEYIIATQEASETVPGYVNTGIQTFAGVKTFSSSPIVPTPTTATQTANKGYVDGVAGGVANFAVCQGRLTLTSGVPETTTDVLAATTLYFTPYNGNLVGLYSGASWSIRAFTELSLDISSLTASTNYDIFIYDNSGTLTLEALAWTDGTTRATALTTQDGIYVKNGATTRRYLGTIRTTASAGQCEDSGFGNSTTSKRFVWNMYNRVRTKNHTYTTTDSWTDAGNGTWSQMNDATSVFKHEFVIGISQQVDALVSAYSININDSCPIIAIGKDAVNSLDRTFSGVGLSSPRERGITSNISASGIFVEGYHYVAGIETTTDPAAALFFGDNKSGAFPSYIAQACFESTIER